MISKKTTRLLFLIIPIVSFFMHYAIFEKELAGVHVWRQSQTEINIQNFYRHDFNVFNRKYLSKIHFPQHSKNKKELNFTNRKS